MSLRVRVVDVTNRPSCQIWWFNSAGTLVDFSSGYTFELRIGSGGATRLVDKTTGITGAAGAGVAPTGTPNVTIAWTAGELAVLAQGSYTADLLATDGSGNVRLMRFALDVDSAVT